MIRNQEMWYHKDIFPQKYPPKKTWSYIYIESGRRTTSALKEGHADSGYLWH